MSKKDQNDTDPREPGNSDEAIAAARAAGPAYEGGQDVAETAGYEAVADALKDGVSVFNTHSQAFAGRLIAEGNALRQLADDIDEKIEKLQAERNDVMLAWSGCNAALGKLQQ